MPCYVTLLCDQPGLTPPPRFSPRVQNLTPSRSKGRSCGATKDELSLAGYSPEQELGETCLYGYRLLLLPLHHSMTDVQPRRRSLHDGIHRITRITHTVCFLLPDTMRGRQEKALPVAGEDLLRYLDGDVTLLPPLVQIQQVSSEARGRLKSSLWRDVRVDHEGGTRGKKRECETRDISSTALMKPQKFCSPSAKT